MKTKMIKTALSLCLVFSLVGCESDDERLQEKARIESEESAKNEVEAQNANRIQWAKQMEEELERRHSFFDAITGRYEGAFTGKSGEQFNLRILINPTLPKYPETDRPRTVEELSYELTNLNLDVQALSWSNTEPDQPTDGLELAFGCVFKSVRPDIVSGKLFLSSEDCKITYTLFVGEKDDVFSVTQDSEQIRDRAENLANDAIDGKLEHFGRLLGIRQSNLASKRFELIVTREDDF